MLSKSVTAFDEIRLARGRSGLVELRERWKDLESRIATPRFYHAYEWFESYLNHLAPAPDEMLFVVCIRDGRTAAIIPLSRYRGGPFRAFRGFSLPEHDHLPLADGLVAAGVSGRDVITACHRELRATGESVSVLRFATVPADSPIALAARPATFSAARRHLKQRLFLVHNGDIDKLFATLSTNFRANLKRRIRIASEQGVTVEYAMCEPALSRAFDAFLRVEASGWKGVDGERTAIALHEDLQAFYRAVLESFGAHGRAFVNILSVANAPVAVQFCVADNDSLYVLKLAYDERQSRLSPGNLLIERAYRELLPAQGLRKLDLVGEPEWFQAWKPEGEPVVIVEFFDVARVGGFLAALYVHARQLAKRLVSAWRARRRP